MPNTHAPDARVLQPDEGELLEILGNRLVIKAAAPRVAVIDYTAPPGFPGPPLHTHSGFDEVFVVLEGVLSARIGEETSDVPSGGTVFVAGGTPHTFTNATDDPLRMLVVCAPGGFEDYFRALATGDEGEALRVSAELGYASAVPRP